MNIRRLYKHKTRHLVIPFIIALLVSIVYFFVLYAVYIQYLHEIFQNDNETRISDSARQTALLVEERMSNNIRTLEQLSSVFYYSEDLFSDSIIEYLRSKIDFLGVGHIDIVQPDGSAYVVSKGGFVFSRINYADEEFFQKAMQGIPVISFLEDPPFDLTEVFVCAVPVFQADGIGGVLVGVYDTLVLEQLLNLNNGLQNNIKIIVTGDGTFITHRNDPDFSKFGNNFFDTLTQNDFFNGYSLESLRGAVMYRTTGITGIKLDGQYCYIAYNPLSFDNCYLFTLIPAESLELISGAFTRLTILIAILQTIFILMIGAFFVVLYQINRKELYNLAFQDTVTGGGNRAWFLYEAEQILQSAEPDQYALVLLDIDNLKILNDTFGYDAGNMVLKLIYQFSRELLDSGEIVSRSMQDDFIMLLHYSANDTLVDRIEKLVAKINNCDKTGTGIDNNYIISLSAGVYRIEDTRLELLSVFDRAAMALSRAKKLQGILLRYAFFQEQDRLRLREEKRIENRMEEALANNEFVVYIQPKYNISTNKVSGAEALIRWLDPEKGMIPPDMFIPLFERNGFIFKIDLFVFEQVCKMIREEIDRGLKPHKISVNLSRAYLNRPHFLDSFKDLCYKYAVPPSYLELELTETIVFENMNILIQKIEEMHSFGFTCSLDDFGSGYSSLNILKMVPVDVLKLDKEFFADTENATDRGASVIESVIELARKLKMKTVSEGVEKEWQVEFLRKAKCDTVQGYIYCRPVPMHEYEKIAFSN